MSTKSSIWGENSDNESTHVYHECFDDGYITPVYIERFTRGKSRNITEDIVLSVQECVAIYFAVSKQIEYAKTRAAMTDADIESRVKGEVAKRASETSAFMLAIAYHHLGDANASAEDQIANGIEYWRESRAKAVNELEAVERIKKELC